MKHKGSELAPLGTFEGKVPADLVTKVKAKEKAILDGKFAVKVVETRAEVDAVVPGLDLTPLSTPRRSPGANVRGIASVHPHPPPLSRSRGGAQTYDIPRPSPLRHHQALRRAGRQRRHLARPRARRGAGAAGRERRRQEHAGVASCSATTWPTTARSRSFGRPLPPGSPRAALAAGIGMVHQHFTLADNLTVLDNVHARHRAAVARRSWRRRDARAGCSDAGAALRPRSAIRDARVGELSVGERQRVEILKALYRGARILILDEPTAVLTPQESEALFATLRQLVAKGLSIIFISHKLDEVLRVSHRVAVLRAGRLVAMRARRARPARRSCAELMVGRAVDDAAGSAAPARRRTRRRPWCRAGSRQRPSSTPAAAAACARSR